MDSEPKPTISQPSISSHELSAQDIEDLLKIKKENELNIDRIRRLILNPVRGLIPPSLLHAYKDLSEKKIELISSLGNIFHQDYNQKIFEFLWDTAINKEVGVDINHAALKVLTNASTIPEGQQTQLRLIALRGQENSDLAALLIGVNYQYSPSEREKLYQLRQYALLYNPVYLENFISSISGLFGDLSNWAKLEAYHILQQRLRGHIKPVTLDQLQKEIIQQIEHKAYKIKNPFNRARYSRSLPTLGVEIQGTQPATVPHLLQLQGDSDLLTTISPKDYKKIVEIGGFIKSEDKYYELALPPTISPVEQALMIQTLFEMGVIQAKEGMTSLHLNLGGIRTSNKYREPAAIQFMLLSAGFCLPLSSDSWDVFTGKQAIHRREARELLPVNNVSVEYGTELRIPLLDNPENTYKMLFLIKDLGWLGIQKQKEIDGLAHSPELVNVWNNLIQSFNGLLEQYHLPSITDMWTFSDFERLRGILSNKDTVDFQHQARKLLTQSRIEMSRLYKEDLPEIVPAQKAETNKSKEPNLSFVDRVEKAILAYEKRLTNFERRFLQPDSEEIESVSSRMRRCFGLLTLSIGSNLYFLLGDNRFITPTLLFYILTNPEAVRGALTTIRSILKSKPELSKAFFSELGNLELISLSYLLTNIICGEKTATLTWTTIFLGSMITNKLIHKFKPIESYV